MRGFFLSALIGVALVGCLSSSAPPTDSTEPGTGGKTSSATGGVDGTGGSTATGGSLGSGGSVTTGTGGSGDVTGTGGATGTGSGGDTTGTGGGNVGGGGRPGTGGRIATGGSTGTGGAGTTGGAPGTGGATTGAVGFPMPLRVDDPCGSLLGGNVCLHQGKTSDNGTPFTKMGSVTLGGTPGMMYPVKIHVRGVVEPTHVTGGTPGTPSQFVTGGSAYANNTNEGQYQQWRLTTTVPNQHYYLNIFTGGLSHVVNLIDYTETIMIGGGSIVTLDVSDGNAHEISNTVKNPPLMAPGAPGSMMSGQFVQIDTE